MYTITYYVYIHKYQPIHSIFKLRYQDSRDRLSPSAILVNRCTSTVHRSNHVPSKLDGKFSGLSLESRKYSPSSPTTFTSTPFNSATLSGNYGFRQRNTFRQRTMNASSVDQSAAWFVFRLFFV